MRNPETVIGGVSIHPLQGRLGRLGMVVAASLAMGGTPALGEMIPLEGHAKGTTVDEIEAFVPLSESVWTDSPCNGRESFTIKPESEMHYTDSQTGQDKVADGLAHPGCAVDIRDGQHGYGLCKTVVHELGHEDGQGHSADPSSIMHAPVPDVYAPCARITIDKQRLSFKALTVLATSHIPSLKELHQLNCFAYPEKKSHRFCLDDTEPDNSPKFALAIHGHHTVDGRPLFDYQRMYRLPHWLRSKLG